MEFWIILTTILLVVPFLLSVPLEINRPSLRVKFNETNQMHVDLISSKTNSESRILFFLALVASLRARISLDFPTTQDIHVRIDQIIEYSLEKWDLVEDGSILDAEHFVMLLPQESVTTTASFESCYTGHSRMPMVSLETMEDCDPGKVLRAIMGGLVATVEHTPRSYRSLLKQGLRNLYEDRALLPIGNWSPSAMMQIGEFCRSCHDKALATLIIDESSLKSDSAIFDPMLISLKLLLPTGLLLRLTSFSSYVFLWMLGVRDLTLVIQGALLNIALYILGGIGISFSRGLAQEGWRARWSSILGNSIAKDGAIIRKFYILGGAGVCIASYVSLKDILFTIAVFPGGAAVYYVAGASLFMLGQIIRESGLVTPWRKVISLTGKPSSLSGEELNGFPRYPFINFITSNVYLCYFAILTIFIMWPGRWLIFKIFDSSSRSATLSWENISIAILMTVSVPAANKLAGLAMRSAKSDIKILILRRFATKQSEGIRKRVAPIFGAYGKALVVYDSSYEGALTFDTYKQNQIEGLWDELGDYKQLVRFANEEWQDGVKELMKQCDICVIDVSDIAEGVAWEIKTALNVCSPAKIVLTASYDAARLTDDRHFSKVAIAVTASMSDDEKKATYAKLQTLSAPLLYGEFPATLIFGFTVYRHFHRLRMGQFAKA